MQHTYINKKGNWKVSSVDLNRHGSSKELWHVLICGSCHVDSPFTSFSLSRRQDSALPSNFSRSSWQLCLLQLFYDSCWILWYLHGKETHAGPSQGHWKRVCKFLPWQDWTVLNRSTTQIECIHDQSPYSCSMNRVATKFGTTFRIRRQQKQNLTTTTCCTKDSWRFDTAMLCLSSGWPCQAQPSKISKRQTWVECQKSTRSWLREMRGLGSWGKSTSSFSCVLCMHHTFLSSFNFCTQQTQQLLSDRPLCLGELTWSNGTRSNTAKSSKCPSIDIIPKMRCTRNAYHFWTPICHPMCWCQIA